MTRRWLPIVALAAVLPSAGAAFASPTPSAPVEAGASSLALPMFDPALAGPSLAMSTTGTGEQIAGAAAAVINAISYRPRGYRGHDRYDSGPRSATPFETHAGFFDPNGDGSNAFVFGFRGGVQADDHVQIGIGADWNHSGGNETQVVGEVPLPGGGTTKRERQLSRSSQDLVPLLGYIQLSGDGDMQVIPYAGFGGGYEVLFLSAEDFSTHESFDATYGGWGWQAWAGAAIPLSGRTRLNGEVFVNDATVGRDVDDALTGETFRETVKQNGVGMRFGFSWGF